MPSISGITVGGSEQPFSHTPWEDDWDVGDGLAFWIRRQALTQRDEKDVATALSANGVTGRKCPSQTVGA